MSETDYPVTGINRLKRAPTLDAALICHIAYVIDGRPYCTPTGFGHEDDHLY